MRTSTLALLTLTTGCVIVRGSGTLGTETRTVPSFVVVEADNGVDVDLLVDPQHEGDVDLEVATDANLLDRLLTDAQGRTLRVDVEGNVSTRLGLSVSGTVPPLEALLADNGAVLNVDGLVGSNVDLTADNGAVLTVTGAADGGVVTALNGAVVDASGLTFGDVTVEVNDGAVLDLCATGRVTGVVNNGAVLDVSCGGGTAGVDVRNGGVLTD